MTSRWTPHATVATIVTDDQGRFLMVRETVQDLNSGREVINQPAGHIEANEAILDAAVRETLEETGWHVELTGLLGLYTYTAPSNGVTYHRYCFTGRPVRYDAEAPLDDGIIGPAWMTIDELRQSEHLRSEMVLTCCEDYLAKPHYPLDIITEHP